MTENELVACLQQRGRADDVLALIAKLGFTPDFVAKNILSAGPEVTVAQTAMLWMGMPNKHDRKRTRQLFEALSEAGLLEIANEKAETWRIICR